MVKRTTVSIVGLLIFVVLAVGTDDPGAHNPAGVSTPDTPRADLSLSMDSCTQRSNSLRVEGSVRNNGEVTVQLVQVRLTWEDANGDVVDTSSDYAVGFESLRPGESSTFRGTTLHSAARFCTVSLLDYRVVR